MTWKQCLLVARRAYRQPGLTAAIAATSGLLSKHMVTPEEQRPDTYRCISRTKASLDNAQGEGTSFRFYGADCRDCPLWEACRGPASAPNSQRAVYLTPYHTHLRAAAAFNATPDGQALLRSRWQVEPTIAWLVRYNGCRQARRVGVAAAQCQLFQACAVRNLQLWLGRLDRRAAPMPAADAPTRGDARLEVPLAA